MAVTTVTDTAAAPPPPPPPPGGDPDAFNLVVKEQQAVKDIRMLSDKNVGHADSVNSNLKNAGLTDIEVNPDSLDSDLKFLHDTYKKLSPPGVKVTWGNLSWMATEHGWKELDNEFKKIADGDFSNTRYGGTLYKLFTGSGADLNTANIKVNSTIADRLPQMKDHLRANGNWGWSDDTLTVASAFSLVQANSWNKKPGNAKEFMQNASMVADGKTDGTALLGQTLDEGWAGIKDSDKIASEFIVPGSNLDKLLSKDAPDLDPESRYDINYRQLVRSVSQEADTVLSSKQNEMTQDLSDLHALVNDADFLGSPGNDARTVIQNLEGLAGELDSTKPGSHISKIFDKYQEVYDDMKALDDLGIKNSPALTKWVEERMLDIVDLNKQTGEFLNDAANYLNQASSNLDFIEDQASKEQLTTALVTVFAGIAAIGSIGFGVSNGRAVFGSGQQWANQGGWMAMNLPALFGSVTLFTNNAVNTGVNADKLVSLEKTFHNINMAQDQIDHIKEGLTFAREDFSEGIENLETAQRRIDYRVSEKSRFKDYYDWAMQHQGESSIFGNGDDSAYGGNMPYKTWETGQWTWRQGPGLNWMTWWHFVSQPDWVDVK